MGQGNEFDDPSRFLLELLPSWASQVFRVHSALQRCVHTAAYVFCHRLPQPVIDRAVIPDRARFQNNNGFENQNSGFELAIVDWKSMKVLEHFAVVAYPEGSPLG